MRARATCVFVGFVVALAVMAAAGCGAATGTGTIVGGIEPAGLHPRGTYVGGTVHVTDASGGNASTTRVAYGQKFRLKLRPGAYLLRAEYQGEPCVGRAVVKVATTVSANVVCL